MFILEEYGALTYLTHLYRVDSSTLTLMTGSFPTGGISGYFSNIMFSRNSCI